jgi:hypothetical protein
MKDADLIHFLQYFFSAISLAPDAAGLKALGGLKECVICRPKAPGHAVAVRGGIGRCNMKILLSWAVPCSLFGPAG